VGYFESEPSNIVGFEMALEFGVNMLSAQNVPDGLDLNCHECLVHKRLMMNDPKCCPTSLANHLIHCLVLIVSFR
jgi:hypothetical protein